MCAELPVNLCAQLAARPMAWQLWFSMICGGAGTRLGSRRSVSVTHERMGLGSSFKAPKRPSSSALLLGWLLLFIPPASSVVCPSCKDTIPGCKGGADCPLLKTPMENAASLAGTSTSKSPDLTQLLPPELLCTFTKSVSTLVRCLGGCVLKSVVLQSDLKSLWHMELTIRMRRQAAGQDKAKSCRRSRI